MGEGHLSVPNAQTIGLFVECILYGIYLSTLVLCLKNLLFRPKGRRLSRVKWLMLAVTLIFFAISTSNVSLGLARGLDPNWTNTIVKPATFGVQVIIADAFLTYRCFIVYERSRIIIIFPLFLWTSTVVLTIISNAATKIFSTSSPSSGMFWIGALVSSTTLNIYASAVIAYRIWAADRYFKSITGTEEQGPCHRRLRKITRIIVESAVLYTMAMIIDIVCVATRNNFRYPASSMAFQMIGISSNLIIIRVASNTEQNFSFNPSDRLTTLDFARNSTKDGSIGHSNM